MRQLHRGWMAALTLSMLLCVNAYAETDNPTVLNETGSPAEADFCVVQFPSSMTAEAGQSTEPVFGRLFEAGTTESPGASLNVVAEVGFGPVGSDPRTAAGWQFKNAAYQTQAGNDDEYAATLTAPDVTSTTTYSYAYRFSLDGGSSVTYCDLDGAGSTQGVDFDPAALGTWIVAPDGSDPQPPADGDVDGVPDGEDNCPSDQNPAQADLDEDGRGDACDPDDDNDSVSDTADNCATLANTDQADNDADRRGDACDPDDDNDGVGDGQDNCRFNANPNQQDDDNDGKGDACDGAFDSSPGKATGGGWLAASAKKVHFSVSAKSANGVLDGTCTITTAQTKIKCLNVDSYHQSVTSDRVVIVGAATVDGAPTRYRIVLEDRGDPGTADRLTMSTDAGFSIDGVISGGNIQIHRS